VLSWLLVGLLCIIWAALLLPSRRRSPVSSIEEFEQKMSVLAETNNASSGRWVLMPQKGRPFLGVPERQRARVRRRRRRVFVGLLDASVLTLLMGLFPPFRVMLYATASLLGLLLVYAAILVRIREDEIAMTRARVRRLAAYPSGYARPNGSRHSPEQYAGNGHTGEAAGGRANGGAVSDGFLRESGVHLLDEGVHVVVRRSDEVDVTALREAAR
jgi:hypothetical protein